MPTEENSDSSQRPRNHKDPPQLSFEDQAFLESRTKELISQGALPGVADRRARAELSEKKGARGRGGEVYPNTSPVVVVVEGTSSPPRSTTPPTPPSSLPPSSSTIIRMRLRELGIHGINQILARNKPERILEALDDYQEALGDGFNPENPTGYFRSLL